MSRLLVMRLADMVRVHPNQIESTCPNCGETVGIYPSGQQMLQENPELEIVCQKCVGGPMLVPAPSTQILEEMKQSVKRR